MGEWNIRCGDEVFRVKSFTQGRARKMAKVVVDGNTTVGITESGAIFASNVRGRYSFAGHDRRTLKILDCLAKLGCLDQKAVDALQKEHNRRGEVLGRACAASQLASGAKALGVTLTPAIKRKITNAQKARKALSN